MIFLLRQAAFLCFDRLLYHVSTFFGILLLLRILIYKFDIYSNDSMEYDKFFRY